MSRITKLAPVGLFAAIVAIGVIVLASNGEAEDAFADSNHAFSGFICNPSGTWLGNSDAGDPTSVPLTYTEQFSPIDLRTMNYRIEFKNVDATWGHPFLAETDEWLGMKGIARLGKRDKNADGQSIRRYDVTAIGYGIMDLDGARGQIQHITTMISTIWTEGCDTKKAETVLRVYDYTADTDADGIPDVDKNLDGIPDEDAVPLIMAPPAGAPVDSIPFPESKRIRANFEN